MHHNDNTNTIIAKYLNDCGIFIKTQLYILFTLNLTVLFTVTKNNKQEHGYPVQRSNLSF